MVTKRIDNIYDVVKRLLGEIEPQGEANIDYIRLENLKDTISLVERLINDIILVARHKDVWQHSISECGKNADEFITRLKERVNS